MLEWLKITKKVMGSSSRTKVLTVWLFHIWRPKYGLGLIFKTFVGQKFGIGILKDPLIWFFAWQVPECHMMILCFIHFIPFSAYLWVIYEWKWNFEIFILVKVGHKYENLWRSFSVQNIRPMVHKHEKVIKWETFLGPYQHWGKITILLNSSHSMRKT